MIDDGKRCWYVIGVGRYVEKNDKLVGRGVELVCLGVGRYVKKMTSWYVSREKM